MFPILYGIGVGPGDPDLITLKAVKVLAQARHVFTASSSKRSYSLALSVARRYLPPEVEVEFLKFPMTKERKALVKAWEENAQQVVEVLRQKGEAVFLTMGDPTLYSTFGPLARAVKALWPEVELRLIPGVTAAQAAASRLGISLAEGEEGFAIISGLSKTETISRLRKAGISLAIYKVYRRAEEVIQVLRENGELRNTLAISWCGFPKEAIYKNPEKISSRSLSYFTLFLVGGHILEHPSNKDRDPEVYYLDRDFAKV